MLPWNHNIKKWGVVQDLHNSVSFLHVSQVKIGLYVSYIEHWSRHCIYLLSEMRYLISHFNFVLVLLPNISVATCTWADCLIKTMSSIKSQQCKKTKTKKRSETQHLAQSKSRVFIFSERDFLNVIVPHYLKLWLRLKSIYNFNSIYMIKV